MSIMDLQTTFDDAAAITVTRNSTNVIDLGVARNIGRGRELKLVATVGAAFTAAGAATLTPTLVVADSADLATNPTTIWTGLAIPKASLVAGYKAIDVSIPSYTRQRYMGVVWTVATGPMTAGTITARVQIDSAESVAGQEYPAAGSTDY